MNDASASGGSAARTIAHRRRRAMLEADEIFLGRHLRTVLVQASCHIAEDGEGGISLPARNDKGPVTLVIDPARCRHLRAGDALRDHVAAQRASGCEELLTFEVAALGVWQKQHEGSSAKAVPGKGRATWRFIVARWGYAREGAPPAEGGWEPLLAEAEIVKPGSPAAEPAPRTATTNRRKTVIGAASSAARTRWRAPYGTAATRPATQESTRTLDRRV